MLNILPHHLAHLHESGLSDQTIAAAGIVSETNPQRLAAMLNWLKPTKGLAPAIVFPFTGADGRNGFCRVRPDTPRKIKNKPVKYESPRGEPNHVYLPPGVAASLGDPMAELFITEGEKKALAATQFGFPCIGLVGVFGWKQKNNERLLVELEQVNWNGRQVRIAFDSDLDRKPDVQLAESRLAKLLADRGAKVRCMRLPDGAPDADGKPTKMGVDDFLVVQGAAAFRKLADTAVEPELVEGAEDKADASTIDPGEAAKEYLNALRVDGLPKLRFWRGSLWVWSNGAYREQSESEVRADLIRRLDLQYRDITSGVVSCILDHIKAHAVLWGRIEPGRWLSESPPCWQPREMLSTRDSVIHLPSLIAGAPDAIIPATPRYFATAALEFNFDARAALPNLWQDFLNQLWPDDPEAIDTLQEWMGYCLTPDTRQQKILLTVGPRRSGKGTISRVTRELVGRQNVAGPTLASLATNFGLASLVGKSLAVISDARLSGRTDSAIVIERLLSISGEDPLTVDRKYNEALHCILPTRLMLLTNELPRMSDASGALSGRFVVLHLKQSFYGREDHRLLEKLSAELPGILLWAIAGWQRLNERGHFVQPQSGRELAEEMEDIASPIAAFVRERCEVDPGCGIPVDELYAEWCKWTSAHGWKKTSTVQVFGRDLRAAFPSITTRQPRDEEHGRRRYYYGIALVV